MGDAARPSGTVTFLFTDIEGSTRLWESDPDEMRNALAAHDDVLRAAIEGQGGWLFKHTGDGVCAAFDAPGIVQSPSGDTGTRPPTGRRLSGAAGWCAG